jgi:hypothetical protein
VFFGLVSKTLVIKAKSHTGITQVLAGIGWAKGQVDVDTTKVFTGRGYNITLVCESKRRVGIAKSSDGNGMETLVCTREEKIEMWLYVKDYGSG